jgi:hypothetical protein
MAMLAFFIPGRAMKKPRLQLGEALDLVRSIELHCRELRREGGTEVERHVAELDEVICEIREQLNLVIVTVSQTRES